MSYLSTGKIGILSLSDETLDEILSYCSYDEVSRLRLVCRKFNDCAQRVLNKGFYQVEKFHSECCLKLKLLLPRRESERRKHPLAMHCDILTSVKTRLSLLGMTFMKFIEAKRCCFIPGKVLDELFRVLHLASDTNNPCSHYVLQELRDITSMAMEHFDEKIAPALRKKIEDPSGLIGNGHQSLEFDEMGIHPVLRNLVITPCISVVPITTQQLNTDRFPSCTVPSESDCCGISSISSIVPNMKPLIALQRGYKKLYNKYKQMRKKSTLLKRKMWVYQMKLKKMDQKISEQSSLIREQASRVTDHNDKLERLLIYFKEHKSMSNIKTNADNTSPACSPKCPAFVEIGEQLSFSQDENAVPNSSKVSNCEEDCK